MNDARDKLRCMAVYALLTEQFCRLPWQQTARALVDGGADVIQLREKELPAGEFLARARWLRGVTAERGVLLIVNARADLAMLSGADGVHLGQDDVPPAEARKLLGAGPIIGWSTASLRQARAALALPVAYIGIGPVYPTATKGYEHGHGADLVRRISEAVDLTSVAIGGITIENAGPPVAAGATGVAVCAALCGAEDPAEAVRALRAVVEGAR